ncbi:MAG: hypothetical protein AAF497_08865 [Planctomycetota bacterium]
MFELRRSIFVLLLASCLSTCSGQGLDGPFNHWLLQSNAPEAQPLTISSEIGAIFLNRRGAAGQSIVFDQDFNEISNANQLDGGIGNGVLFKVDFLNVSRTEPIDFAFEMFSIDRISARQNLEADEVIPYFFDAIPINPTDQETVTYISDLQNYEFNLRYRGVPGIQLLAGVRYFEVDETFDVFHSFGTVNRLGFFSFNKNEFLGGQIGIATTFWSNAASSIYGSAKYGFMRNYVGGRANALDAFGNSVNVRFTDNNFSNLLDLELGVYGALTKRFGFKGGYRGIFVDSFAALPDQSAEFHLFGGPGEVAYRGGRWHGFFVSIETVW